MSQAREGREVDAGLVEGAKQALLQSIDEIGAERHEFASQAQWLKRINSFFNVSIVLLGVAAPAVVTYLTQQPTQDPSLTLKTIVIVGVAGAFATLRGVLKWGEKYGFAVMTAMKLRELEANARLEMEEILHTSNDVMIYGKLSNLNREIQEKWTEIIRRHLVSGGSGGEGE
ncbi:MAG: hypothetical protein RRA94_10030 [Bacteroidota bacterium]|nr:hypothetical protein [Bacteroidota bacterium]